MILIFSSSGTSYMFKSWNVWMPIWCSGTITINIKLKFGPINAATQPFTSRLPSILNDLPCLCNSGESSRRSQYPSHREGCFRKHISDRQSPTIRDQERSLLGVVMTRAFREWMEWGRRNPENRFPGWLPRRLHSSPPSTMPEFRTTTGSRWGHVLMKICQFGNVLIGAMITIGMKHAAACKILWSKKRYLFRQIESAHHGECTRQACVRRWSADACNLYWYNAL